MALNSKVAIDVEIKNIKKVADLKKEIQGLRKEQKEAEKQAKTGQFTSKKSEKQYISTAKAIKGKSKNLRDLNKNLSSSTKATKAATKSSNGMAKQFIKGAAAIGIIIGAFRAVSRIINSVVSTFTEFEFTMSKVNAVSGATEKEFAALTKTAEELGRTTFFTATQVGELMLNYSKLGFTAQEIQAAVRPTLDLATATGSDLARAALVAGAAVRGFGLDASETNRVVDVMAVSFSSSAMNIEKWQTSMTKVAPIAKAAGFSIEDTAAIMSKLTDAGIEASIAGTSLRNILLKMQDPTSDLSKAFGGTIHSLDDLIPAMKKFSEEGGDMAAIMEVVDLRQAAAFEQMITSADATLELRDRLREANGEAARMAKIIGDTLQGSFLKFSSAAQGLSIAIMKDFAASLQSSMESLAQFFNMLARNSKTITTIIDGIVFLTKAFVAGFIAQKAYAVGLAALRVGLGLYRGVTVAATAATYGFAASMRALKAAIASTGVGLLVIALGELAARWLFAADAQSEYVEVTSELVELEERLANIKGSYNKEMNKQFAKTVKQADEDINNVKSKIALAKSLYFASKNGVIKLTKNEEDAHIAGIKRLKFRLKLEKKNKKQIINKINEQNALEQDLIFIQEQKLKKAKEVVTVNEEQLKVKNATIKVINDEISRLKELGIEEEKNTDKKKKDNTAAWERIDIMKQVLAGTKSLEDAERELRDMAISRTIAELDAIPKTIMDGELRLKLEQKLIDLLYKKKEATEQTAKSEAAARTEAIADMRDVGNQLITIAGEEENLHELKKIGIQLSQAAAIAAGFEAIAKYSAAIADTALNSPWWLKIINVIGLIGAMASTYANMKALKKSFGSGGMIEEFADGGMVHGASHENGGVKFAVGGRVNELEGGEAVINKRSTAMFRNQLSSMNQAGGGVKFADGGLMSSPAFTEAQFNANNQNQMMGAMQGQRKVVVVESDITNSQSTVSVIQANATF